MRIAIALLVGGVPGRYFEDYSLKLASSPKIGLKEAYLSCLRHMHPGVKMSGGPIGLTGRVCALKKL
jgi:hypothetical protein